MKIIVSSRAKKELRKIPKIDQIAVTRKISSLIENLVVNEEKLTGFKNVFRIRVGNYRIVYRKTSQEIHIVLIHHRKDVYRIVNQLLK